MLRVYYENGDPMAMESLCHSFRMYIERNRQISVMHKANYLTYLRFYRRLINTPPMARERLVKLKDDIQHTKMLNAGRKWLLVKLEALLDQA
ncbi:MAG: hypothetical protein AAF570_25770 [Bacteroidota bacterium]